VFIVFVCFDETWLKQSHKQIYHTKVVILFMCM